MPAPDTIDMSGGGGTPWPGFAITGATAATGVNATFALTPFGGTTYTWASAAGATVSGESGDWTITGSNATEYFTGTGEWPWSAQTWTPAGGAGGTLALDRTLAAPDTIAISGSAAAVAATLTTALSGSNNDLVFTSVLSGRLGNDIRVRYVNPGTNNAALSVSVSGRDITVNLATDGDAANTSTAAQVDAAIDASPAAAALVTPANAAANTGAGIVPAMAYTALSGGTGGLPLPPDTITL